jgi:hypothetical protein
MRRRTRMSRSSRVSPAGLSEEMNEELTIHF